MNGVKKTEENFDFSDLLYHAYISKIPSIKYKNILEKVFKYILGNKDKATNFWSDKAALLLCLEILEQQEIIETDLGKSLQDYNQQLIYQFSKQNYQIMAEDLPFYAFLILHRFSHEGNYLDRDKVLLLQISEKLIQDLILKKTCIVKNNIHFHIAVLLKLFNLNIGYEKIIHKELLNIYEVTYQVCRIQSLRELVYMNNLMIYPSLCQFLNLESRIDLKLSISNFVTNNKDLLFDANWLEKFYFINALILYNANDFSKCYNSDIDFILKIEAEKINLQTNNSIDFDSRLLALTKYSFDEKTKENPLCDIFLVPKF